MGIMHEVGVHLKATTEDLDKFDTLAGTVREIDGEITKASKSQTRWTKKGKETITAIEKLTRTGKEFTEITTKIDKTAISPKQKDAIKNRIKLQKDALKLENRLRKERETEEKGQQMESIRVAKEVERGMSRLEKVKLRREKDTLTKSKKSSRENYLIKKKEEILNRVMVETGAKTQGQAMKLISAEGDRFNKRNQLVKNSGKVIKETSGRYNKHIGVLSRFNMEQLGVMFGGMALNRAMVTLNATSREWLGIGELTSTMMGITMLEANMDLLEYGIIPLFDALTNLPPAAQKAIGYTAMALEGLGMSMMVGGQLMLGLDSTATLLSKIAGVSPELIFTEKGLTGLKNKLSGVVPMMGKLAKYAAAGILIGIALKDVSEEQYIAAVGGTAMAAGIIMGGKKGGAVFLIGAALKLVGDEDFLVDVIKVLYKVGEIITSVIKEAMWSAMTFRGFDIENIEGMADVQNAMDRAYEEITMERAGTGKMEIVAVPVTSLMAVQKRIEELEAQHTKNMETEYGRSEESLAEYISNKAELEEEMEKITQDWRDAVEREEEASNKRREDEADRFRESFIGKMMISPAETVSDILNIKEGGITPFKIFTNLFKPDETTPKAVGGKVRNTGQYFLHEGEEVIPKTGVNSGQVNVNTTYHVTVSDKKEFESLLRKNNQSLTSEVRRIVRV